MRFEVEFRSTPEQFLEVAKELRRLVYRGHLDRFVKRSLLPILVCVAVIMIETDVAFTAFIAGSVTCYLGIWLATYWRYDSTLMESWKTHANTWADHKALISNSEIQLETPEIRTYYRWKTFKARTDSPNYLILWQDGYALLALPRRVFTPEQMNELNGFLDNLQLPRI